MSITINTDQVIFVVTAICSAVAGSVTTARRFVRPLLGMVKEWREFREDWQGLPDRPGFKGHPGMPERMASVELAVEQTRCELLTNHGTSLKDAVRRIEAQQALNAVHAGAPLLASPTHAASNGVIGSDAASHLEVQMQAARREAA